MKAPEVKILDTWKTLGMRGTRSDDVLIDGLFVPDASVAFSRKAGEWHPVFQIIATVAFPLIYAAYLGVAESARDIALGLAKRKGPTPRHDQPRRAHGHLAARSPARASVDGQDRSSATSLPPKPSTR